MTDQQAEATGEAMVGLGIVGLGLSRVLGAGLEMTTAWTRLVASIDEIRALVGAIQEAIVALTQNEQAEVNRLSQVVDTLATDLGAAQAAAAQVKSDMQAQIDTLQAGATVSAAQINALQAAADAMETDVIGALSPITDRLGEIDSGLKTPADQGGGPLTPDGA